MKEINEYIIEKLKIDKDVDISDKRYTINDYHEGDVCIRIDAFHNYHFCTIRVIKILKILSGNYISYNYFVNYGGKNSYSTVRGSFKYENDPKELYRYLCSRHIDSKSHDAILLTSLESINLLKKLKDTRSTYKDIGFYKLWLMKDPEVKLYNLRKSQIDADFVKDKDIDKYINQFYRLNNE